MAAPLRYSLRAAQARRQRRLRCCLAQRPEPSPGGWQRAAHTTRWQYRAKRPAGPVLWPRRVAMREGYRQFYCARCDRTMRICSVCDRGQIYCGKTCSGAARRWSSSAAGRRYQQTRRGRRHHAARQASYRARRRASASAAKKVTHQGSTGRPHAATLCGMERRERSTPVLAQPSGTLRCDSCGQRLSDRVRFDFLSTPCRSWRRRE